MSIPFESINAAALAALPSLLSDWFPAGKRIGNEYVLGDLRGNPGRSLSVNVRNGKWADFSSHEKGGDPISLAAAAFHGGDRVAAARDLGHRLGIYVNGATTERVSAPAPQPEQTDIWKPGIPPADAAMPDLGWFDHVWPYRDAEGEIIRYVCRRDGRDGGRKVILPMTWGELIDGKTGEVKTGWHRKHPTAPRCLYGLDRLAALPDRTVIVCEGEKAADAAQILFPEYPVVTWSAGTDNVAANDWSPLARRCVIIWPDNDEPGRKAAGALRDILAPIVRSVEILRVDDMPPKADAADVRPDDPAAWLHERLAAEEPEPEYDPPHFEEPDTEQEAQQPDEGVIPLGHDRGTYFYLSRATGQVEAVPAAQHSRAMLKHLASEAYYWERTRFMGAKGVDWNAAADDLMVQCRRIGIFDPDRLRGRGAWLDAGRPVLHLGDRLIANGRETGLLLSDSRHIYERAAAMNAEIGEPLSSAEAKRLMDLCCAAQWESPEHMGRLLAGWCVIAPVCGAMPWRPHLWITSEAGGGKSWILDNIIKPTVGQIALSVQSKTTEAGIRQTLGCEARPVIFDEAETQNDRDRDRVQLVLDLARQASSEEGAAIIKGASNGKAALYRIRSCFVFSSINVGLSQAADESRTVVLTLAPSSDPEKRREAFDKISNLHRTVMVPGFAAKLLARTLSLLPVIRQNAIVFAETIARSGQSRRTGDTYGVLLAGAWSLRSSKIATPEEAEQFVAQTSWVREAVTKGEADPEWQRALGALLQHRTRVANGNGRSEDVPIGELIEVSQGIDNDTVMRPADATLALGRIGIRVAHGCLFVANHASACQEAFARTPWASSWLATLSRTPGAKRSTGPMRMGGTLTKALSIPLKGNIG